MDYIFSETKIIKICILTLINFLENKLDIWTNECHESAKNGLAFRKKKAKKKLELALINTIQPEMGGKNTATHTRCFQNRPVWFKQGRGECWLPNTQANRDNHMGEWLNRSTEAGNRQRTCRTWPEVYHDTLPLGPDAREWKWSMGSNKDDFRS